MGCKHLNNGKCGIKEKNVDKYECDKCLLRIENYQDSIFGSNNMFEDFFGKYKK